MLLFPLSTEKRPRRAHAFTVIEVMIAITILSIGLSALASSIYTVTQGEYLLSENRRAVEISQVLIEKIQSSGWDALGKHPSTWHRREIPTPLLKYCELSDGGGEFMHRPMTDEPSGINIYQYIRHGTVSGQAKVGPGGSSMGQGAENLTDYTLDLWGYPYVMEGQKSAFKTIDPGAIEPINVESLARGQLMEKYNTPLRYNWLQFLGFLDKPSGLRNLKVYVEYYRASTMEGVNNRGEWQENLAKTENALDQSHILLDLTKIEQSDVNSVLIRIVITWDRRVGQVGRHEVTLARRK